MHFFKRAKVYLVGRASVDDAEIQRFLRDEETEWSTDTDNAGQMLPELAGRVCYMSFGKRQGRRTNRDYLGHILSVGHGSVLEHTNFNLLFTGVSRSLTHELVRHRAGFGYSQLSQRYVDESEANFVLPPAVQGDPELEKLVQDQCEAALAVYAELTKRLAEKYATPDGVLDAALREEQLVEGEPGKFSLGEPVAGHDHRTLEEWRALLVAEKEVRKVFKKRTLTARRKAAREAARSVLPSATETKIFVTANARSWRHFIELRGDVHAEAEIRALACDICRLLKGEAPNLFGDYDVVTLPDGSERTKTTHRKV